MSELMMDINGYDNEWVDDGCKCLRQWVSWWWNVNVYDNEWVDDGCKCLWQWVSWWWM